MSLRRQNCQRSESDSLVIVLVLALALVFTAPVMAESGAEPGPSAQTEEEEMPPGEEGAEPILDPQQGETIVVTARKREENLQEVPVAVTVTPGEVLLDRSAGDIAVLQEYTPNLSIYPGRNQSTTLTAFMRGIGQADPLWGVDPGVGLYLDDVYIARPQGALLDVYDVE
ncbi:MAG: Plug domain-containing protein, partial [Thermoanaerobaculia bacterium]|nr:Plug domain-containing protein [Thermoanaerobaculia bacterium]